MRWRMQTLDRVADVERQMAAMSDSIEAENYTLVSSQLEQLELQLQQLFAEPAVVVPANYDRLRRLANDFTALIERLAQKQLQIKDSISQLAGVKFETKAIRTYQIKPND